MHFLAKLGRECWYRPCPRVSVGGTGARGPPGSFGPSVPVFQHGHASADPCLSLWPFSPLGNGSVILRHGRKSWGRTCHVNYSEL